MAECSGCSIGFIVGEEFLVRQEGPDGFGNLFLAGPAVANYGLFDAEGSVFIDGEVPKSRDCDGCAAGGAHGLGGLEVLDVDCFLYGYVADRGAFDCVE